MSRCRVGAALAAVSLSSLMAGAWSRTDDRPLTIPVEPLGFQALPTRFMSTSSTLFTLHFVDDQHLLFTFTTRKLMARLPDADPDDDDRNVTALLLELPSGKVLARTEWRTRDRDRYLWPLEHGRFLLRVRSKLSVIDPLRNFEAEGASEAFRQQTFLELKRPIGYLTVSPGGELLGVETVAPRKPKLVGGAASAAALAATVPGYKKEPELQIAGRPPVQIYFFRLREEKVDGKERLIARTAGLVGAPTLINLPATGDGYLDIKQESSGTWLFDFVSHAGKRLELSAYDTTCAPRPYFVSRSEFVAFGCRGATDKMQLSYFNLKGEQPWLSVLGGTQVSPSIVAAPAAGRFAMNRTLVGSALIDTDSLTADDFTSQEITVMQNFDGRVLLKVQATPIQRSGQNFDLSPLGTKFAVLRGGNLEVYTLPALTGKDQKAVQMAGSLAPEANDAPVKLNSVEVKIAEAEKPEETKPAETPAVATAPVAASPQPIATALPAGEAVQQSAPAAAEGASGDVQGAARKQPSLYSPDYPRTKDDPAPRPKPE
jgi:hypothetical protein